MDTALDMISREVFISSLYQADGIVKQVVNMKFFNLPEKGLPTKVRSTEWNPSYLGAWPVAIVAMPPQVIAQFRSTVRSMSVELELHSSYLEPWPAVRVVPRQVIGHLRFSQYDHD